MENKADKLMRDSILGPCPDCGDERILVAVADTEYVGPSCDAAVFVLDGLGAAALVTRLAS